MFKYVENHKRRHELVLYLFIKENETLSVLQDTLPLTPTWEIQENLLNCQESPGDYLYVSLFKELLI